MLSLAFLGSCKLGHAKSAQSAAAYLHQAEDQLTEVIIYDVFTPPVASRIYAYTSLAAYEAIRFSKPGNESLVAKMRGFGKMPLPDKNKSYDFTLAAMRAFFSVSHKVVFSLDKLEPFEKSVYDHFADELKKEVYDNSVAFGDSISKVMVARLTTDNYLKSRSKQKYLGSNDAGKWRPTPPDYLDGVEWCWNEMFPLLLDSSSQFIPGPPPIYSTDTSSPFFRAVKEVYDIQQNLTEEQRLTARFWDDNPFVIEHSGHLMFGNKKITPGGHWMGIAAIAAKESKADAVKTALTYALTSTALYDAFISCWQAKYKWSYIRPVTVINEFIDKKWNPMLQTPPFPEYSSGHSTITAAAATMLTKLYGNNFAFNDTSDLRYIGMQRKFSSFYAASDQCSVSRLYGGIHYRLSVDTGAVCGKKIGAYIISKIGL